MEKDENLCHKAAYCNNYQPYVCDELCSFDLNTSWLNGKYDIGCWIVEVNSSLSFVSFEAKEDCQVCNFTFQGNDADDVIQQVFDLWYNNDILQSDAIEQWANMYLF